MITTEHYGMRNVLIHIPPASWPVVNPLKFRQLRLFPCHELLLVSSVYERVLIRELGHEN
jgi:hypothetical protein